MSERYLPNPKWPEDRPPALEPLSAERLAQIRQSVMEGDAWIGDSREMLRAIDQYRARLEAGQEDTARLDFLAAWCDGLSFKQKHPGDMEPSVILDWFAGDGGGWESTEGATWREAIDLAKSPPAKEPG